MRTWSVTHIAFYKDKDVRSVSTCSHRYLLSRMFLKEWHNDCSWAMPGTSASTQNVEFCDAPSLFQLFQEMQDEKKNHPCCLGLFDFVVVALTEAVARRRCCTRVLLKAAYLPTPLRGSFLQPSSSSLCLIIITSSAKS